MFLPIDIFIILLCIVTIVSLIVYGIKGKIKEENKMYFYMQNGKVINPITNTVADLSNLNKKEINAVYSSEEEYLEQKIKDEIKLHQDAEKGILR